MGWFAVVTPNHPMSCPVCGEEMTGGIQTKGYDEDGEYYMKHGEPKVFTIDEAFIDCSKETSGGGLSLDGVASCHKCSVYASITMYRNK